MSDQAKQSRAGIGLDRLPPGALDLAKAFADAGGELALVGGPVRDAVLARPVQDLDFATNLPPDQSSAVLRRWARKTWETGRAFGTVAGTKDGMVVEVTTYRTEEYEPGSRKPEVRYGQTIEGDLSRRDFTVNAMAVMLAPEVRFVDPHHGLDDLAARLLRTPAPATQSFDDDPLRMMRAARFAAQLAFDVDESVVSAMAAMADRLQIVSRERVQNELVKLILAPQPRRGLELMVYTGLADAVLPELPALQLQTDAAHHHKDVYAHSLSVLERAMALETGPDGTVPGPDLVLRLAALLHDIGKPATRRLEAGGQVSFHHHEAVGAKLAAKRLRELRFDSATVKDVARLIELHMRFHGYGEAAWTDSAVRRYVADAGPLLARLHRLARADCTTQNARRAERLSFAYDDLERRIGELAEQEELRAIRPDLNGDQIMAALGIGPGKDVGRAYRFLLDLRIAQGPLDQAAATAALLAWWANQTSDAVPQQPGAAVS
ncbi:MAG: CCA tRNA nucleotidyltransferase [Bifidobacteriaceae bacterium]|jgi:poly(A) polymerase|nr:CCA tRNA nucleotidyltransferase [Bifidobacteriaceae bacterium]